MTPFEGIILGCWIGTMITCLFVGSIQRLED